MSFAERLDNLIAPIAPAWAASRQTARNQLAVQRMAGERVRQYDAAQSGRRTAGWPRSASSANSELQRGGVMLSRAAHDLVRNDKYAAAGVGQMVGMIWGDGIVPQFSHEDKALASLAQDEWDRWAESKVDGVGDWYGHGKLSVREMIVGGESLTLWGSDGKEPLNQVMGLEGAQLDQNKTLSLSGGSRIVQGVEQEFGHRPRAYWILPDHPNDLTFFRSILSKRIAAERVDHLFERQRFGQARGASWLAAVAMTLRDIGEIEEAARMREKIQACLALIITAKEGSEHSPLSEPEDDPAGRGNAIERLSPGMIHKIKSGEAIHTVDPQPSQTTVRFVQQQLAAVSANMAPYHLMTGDVSQANYSSLRAAMNGAYTRVDDWQQNEVIPLLCRPAVERRMRVAALKHGDPRFLELKTNFALPIRRMVDPVKDMVGEIMAIRAGLRSMKKALAERGENVDDHVRAITEWQEQIDAAGIALDTDVRKVMGSGKLQDPVGYLAGKPGGEE